MARPTPRSRRSSSASGSRGSRGAVRARTEADRFPFWQLALYATAAAALGRHPPDPEDVARAEPIDRYALCHLTSAAGDTLLAISLADSVFFSLPVGQAKWRVVAYLALTMLPLAVAAPLLVVPLDRAGPRRLISFLAAVVRAASRSPARTAGHRRPVPGGPRDPRSAEGPRITKNGLTMAYARPGRGADAGERPSGPGRRRGRDRRPHRSAPAPWISGARRARCYLAGGVVRVSAVVTLRLPHPLDASTRNEAIGRRGRIPVLTGPAIGAAGMRAATGFVLFLPAFSLRREGFPVSWFAAMAIAAAARRLPRRRPRPAAPEDTPRGVHRGRVRSAGGSGRCSRSRSSRCRSSTIFALAAGAATELGRLAFQSLMQAHAPEGALGTRVRPLRGDVPARVGRRRLRARAALDRLQGRASSIWRASTSSRPAPCGYAVRTRPGDAGSQVGAVRAASP